MTARDTSGTWRVDPSAVADAAPREGSRASVWRKRVAAGLIASLFIGSGIAASVAVHGYAARRSADRDAWHGSVVRVAQVGPSKRGGFTEDGAELQAGSAVSPRGTLRTDAESRARVDLADGTVLVLDRSTTLTLLPAARSLRLEEGQVAVTFASAHGDGDVHLVTKEGAVTGRDAEAVLTALRGRTIVEVVRGTASLLSTGGVAGMVAGDEGELAAGAAPVVAAAGARRDSGALAHALEERPENAEHADDAFGGLGQLVARKPGKTDEKERAITLTSHSASIRIAANVARTEIEEVFTNDSGDDLEGIYRFPLPASAQMEKLALDVDGQMVPGAFVEKARAAAIWRGAIQNAAPKAPKPKEDLVWVPGPWRDPALLEWNGGGRFELRIFPIPRHGSRRVQLAYTEVVPQALGGRRYTYPLPEAPASTPPIERFSVDLQVRGADPERGVRASGYDLRPVPAVDSAVRFTFDASAFRPTGSLHVDYQLTSDRSSDVTAWAYKDPSAAPAPSTGPADPGDAYVALSIRPKLPRWEHESWRDQVIVVDDGRSMVGERFRKAARLASRLVEDMERRDRVTVLVCDVSCRPMPGGWLSPGASSARAVDAFLASVSPDGATDLVGAVRAAAALPDRVPANDLRIVVLSDGAATAGYRRPASLSSAVAEAMSSSHGETLAVAIGPDANVPALRQLAQGGGGVLIPHVAGQPVEDVAVATLTASRGATLRDVELTVPDGLYAGAPAVLPPIPAGGEQLLGLRMKGDRVTGTLVLRGRVGGQPFEARYPLDVRASNEPGNAFVPRLYAAARVLSLEELGGEGAQAEVVSLSKAFQVPSSYTSLLVLESEAMFHAFGIERAPLAPAFTGESDAYATAASDPAAPKDESLRPLAAASRRAASSALADLSGDNAFDDGFGSGAGKGADLPTSKKAARLLAPPAPPATTSAPEAAPSASNIPLERARRPIGRWMRRQWFRTATASAPEPPVPFEKLGVARAALAAAPDERARYKELSRLLALDGAETELLSTLTAWSARDPLDPDLLVARSDYLAREGHREESLRVLSGVLATHLSTKDELDLLRSLARAYGRAGKDQACAFWTAGAELAPQDVDTVSHAAACEHVLGAGRAADRWIESLPSGAARQAAGRLEGKYEAAARAHELASEGASWGDFVIDASWEDGPDLDIVVIDPTGARQAWSSRSPRVRVADPRSTRHETLAFTSGSAGAFMVELVRTDGAGADRPVRGRVKVRALGGSSGGASASREFVLTGPRAVVARIDVRWDSTLVPAENQPIL